MHQPISLMHSFAKIFGKPLATRLAPKLCNMINSSQSAFIKRISIHDKSVYIRGIIKEAQFRNNPLIFLKLDFAKALTPFIGRTCLRLCRLFGFGEQWRKIIFMLLSSASSRVDSVVSIVVLCGLSMRPARENEHVISSV
jgi:hypothetical protein